MAYDNSLNTAKGKKFQERACMILENHYNFEFNMEKPIPIGTPAKDHKFDLVSVDKRYVGECKNYSWTEGNNVPSAKMGFMNQAAFYLSFLSHDINRFIVMRRDIHKKRQEPLADYYYRTNCHLLNGIYIIEIDDENGDVREIGKISK